MSVPMEQWDLPKWYFPMMKTLRAISDIGVLVVEWRLPNILTWYKEIIMKEKIDLSLNRSLEELIASYWEAQYAGLDYKKETHSAFYAFIRVHLNEV